MVVLAIKPCGPVNTKSYCVYHLQPAAEDRGREIIKSLPSVRLSVRHVFA